MRNVGEGFYTALTKTDGSSLINEVDEFLTVNKSVIFNATMIVVAQWIDVCPYGDSFCSEVCYTMIASNEDKYTVYREIRSKQ